MTIESISVHPARDNLLQINRFKTIGMEHPSVQVATHADVQRPRETAHDVHAIILALSHEQDCFAEAESTPS